MPDRPPSPAAEVSVTQPRLQRRRKWALAASTVSLALWLVFLTYLAFWT